MSDRDASEPPLTDSFSTWTFDNKIPESVGHLPQTQLHSLIFASELLAVADLLPAERTLLNIITTSARDLEKRIASGLSACPSLFVCADAGVACARTGIAFDQTDGGEQEVEAGISDLPRVLVAEDNERVRELLCLMLAKLGFPFMAATNGVDALALANLHLFDIVIFDLSMPEMCGFEAMRSLRAGQSANRLVPAIAMSAECNRQRRAAATDAGFALFLAKPFTPARLVEGIGSVLQRSAASPSTPILSGGADHPLSTVSQPETHHV